MRIAVTGGSGFLGTELSRQLVAGGHDVVLLARHDGLNSPGAQPKTEHVKFVRVDIRDVDALTAAFAGCQAVAHCAGISSEVGLNTFKAVHVDGTRNVVRAAERAGVQRLAFVSFLRARHIGNAPYHDTKWAAEEIVRNSELSWTVVKPGIIFGPNDQMIKNLANAIGTLPVFAGVGKKRIRPLAVSDCASVLAASLTTDALDRKTVALVGPTELTVDEAAHMVACLMGRRRLFFVAPTWFHSCVASVCEALMKVPLVTHAQVRMLNEEIVDATGDVDELPLELQPTTTFDAESVRAALPDRRRFGLSDLRPVFGGDVVVSGQGTQTIRRTEADIVEFVLDVEKYRRADHKIGRLHYLNRRGAVGEVKHGGRLLGLPMPPVTLSFEVVAGESIQFRGLRMPWPLKGFSGFFKFEPVDGGTKTTHREGLTFGPIVGRLVRPFVRIWIGRDTPAEMRRMKKLLERDV